MKPSRGWQMGVIHRDDPIAASPAFRATRTALQQTATGCRHLLAGNAPRVLPTAAQASLVCMQHPNRVLCVNCIAEHIRSHDETLERTCDLCGTVGPIHGQLIALGQTDTLRGLDGRKRKLDPPVAVVGGGLGVCPACYATVPDRADEAGWLAAEAIGRWAR